MVCHDLLWRLLTNLDAAGRFRHLFQQLKNAYNTAIESGTASCQDVADAVHRYGTMCLMSLMADEDRHLRLVGYVVRLLLLLAVDQT